MLSDDNWQIVFIFGCFMSLDQYLTWKQKKGKMTLSPPPSTNTSYLLSALQTATYTPLFAYQPPTTWGSWLSHYSLKTYQILVINPLARLYMYGPAIFGWGFWAGQTIEDICAAKTNVPAQFWSDHPVECWMLIERQFNGFVIVIETLLYVWVWYQLWQLMKATLNFTCQSSQKKKKQIQH